MSGGVAPATPLPWSVETPMGESSPWIVQDGQQAYQWEPIATVGSELDDLPPRSAAQRKISQNAAYIVHAANCHHALVEALDSLLRHWTGENGSADRDSDEAVEKLARAALAKAREGGGE